MTQEAFLTNHNMLLSVENMELKKRNAMISGMLDEAMGVFDKYLNVPEARDLRARWDKLKAP